MEPGCISVFPQLAGDKFAGTVDMGKPVVKAFPEKIVKSFIDSLAPAHMQCIGNIFRLYMKRSRMGNIQFFSNLKPCHRQRKRHDKMNHIHLADGPGKHLLIRMGKDHSLGMDNMAGSGKHVDLPHHKLIRRRLPCTYNKYFVSVFYQCICQPSCRHGRSIIIGVKLIDH